VREGAAAGRAAHAQPDPRAGGNGSGAAGPPARAKSQLQRRRPCGRSPGLVRCGLSPRFAL